MLAPYESFTETSLIKSSESSDNGSLLNTSSLSAPPSGITFGTAGPQQIAFVDSGLAQVDDLIASLSATMVYKIGAEQDGAQYISEILSHYGREDISGIHIFSHGQSGGLKLGNMTLNADTLTRYKNGLAQWGESVSGDILLYGCNVAQGETGQSFLEQLAALSGGDIQASDDLTGSALLGGDWVLETSVGKIETGLAIASADQQTYQGVFRAITSDGGGDTATVYVKEGKTTVTDVNSTSDNGYAESTPNVKYSLVAGEDAARFSVDAGTGVLTFKTAPNFESPQDANLDNTYKVSVQVKDAAGEIDIQALSVVVTDVAENPMITTPRTLSVLEGSGLVVDVQASDPEGQTEGNGLTYSLGSGSDGSLFTIDKSTGKLFFQKAPDFEKPLDSDRNNVYLVDVSVSDSTALVGTKTLSITVLNDPSADEEQLLVQENTTLVKQLTLLDGAGAPFRYSLSGSDANQFTIASDGKLHFRTAPDYEKPTSATGGNVYNVTVARVDSAGVSNSQAVAVSVTNQVSVYLLGGQSNMSGVGSSGSDLTGVYASPLREVRMWKNNSYVSLKNGFSLNDGSGTGFGAEIGFGFALEAARKAGTANTEEIYLVKYALGSTSLDVDWNINGVNNQYDKFTASVDSALANLTNAGLGYKVEAMLWMQGESDADIATRANNYASNLTNLIGDVRSRYGSGTDFVIGRLHEELDPVRYLYDDIVRNAQTNVANSNPRNSWVNTDDLAVGADHKHFTSAGHLALGVAFADAVKALLSVNSALETPLVKVETVPAIVPVVSPPVVNVETVPAIVPPQPQPYQGVFRAITSDGGGDTATVYVKEGRTTVTDVNSTSDNGYAESTPNVKYSLVAGEDAARFSVDAGTGVLTFKTAPNFESPQDANLDNTYKVSVQVKDAAGEIDIQALSVVVTDVAENPMITTPRTLSVLEGSGLVVDVQASDPEGQTEGNGLTYSLGSGSDGSLFTIDKSTGKLFFQKAPDFEKPLDSDRNNVYLVDVSVSDSTALVGTKTLSITVLNDPSADEEQLLVQENTTLVKQLTLLDGAGAPFRYSLSGSDANQFTIASDGKLHFRTAPDYEKPTSATGGNVYNVTVARVDSAGVSNSQAVAVSVTNQVSVYLLGGQSNMSGVGSSGSDLTGVYASPLREVRMWKNNSYVSLKNGFSLNDGSGTGFGAEIGFGFALEAARKAGTANTEEIYLVKYALGSTSLDVDWNINGVNNQYDKFTASVDSALANLTNAGLGYKVEAMLWMQGESDADIATRANNYASNLTNLIGDVRSRYGSGTDFVIGRLHEELDPVRYLYDDIVRNAQTNVANSNPRNSWVNTDDLAVGADHKHFTSAGHLALGVAFADAVKALL